MTEIQRAAYYKLVNIKDGDGKHFITRANASKAVRICGMSTVINWRLDKQPDRPRKTMMEKMRGIFRYISNIIPDKDII